MSDHRPRMKPKFAARSIRFGALGVETPPGTHKVWGETEVFQTLPYQGYPNPAPDFVPGSDPGERRRYEPFFPQYSPAKIFIECIASQNNQLRETILQAEMRRFSDLGGLVFSWTPFTFYNADWRYPEKIGAVELLKDIGNNSSTESSILFIVPDADENGTPQGRYWAEKWEDRWGPYTNTTTLHRYQFFCSIGLSSPTTILAPRVGYRTSGFRKRMAWLDSANGIKLLSMEAATKFILHTAVNLWERTRQWEIFPSTGNPRVLRAGEPATEYLADYVWGTIPTGEFPKWTAGPFPPSIIKTFLDNFRTAFTDNDTATMTTLATQALNGSTGLFFPRQAFPTQSRYHLHRVRFPCPQPTYESAPSRNIGLTWGALQRRPEHQPPTWFFSGFDGIKQIHTQSYPEDRIVTYPNTPNESLVEREFQTPSMIYDLATRGVRGSERQGIGSEQEIGTGFPHPTTPVEALTHTFKINGVRSQTFTQTASPAMTVDPMPNAVRWLLEGSTRVISGSILPIAGTGNYEPVSYRARLATILGSTGVSDGTLQTAEILYGDPYSWPPIGLPFTGVYTFNIRYIPSGKVNEGWIGGQQKPTSPDRSFTLPPGTHYIPYAPFDFPLSPTNIKPFIYRKLTSTSSLMPDGLARVFVDHQMQRFILQIFQGWSGTFNWQYKIPGFYAISEPITITVTIP